MWNYSSPGKIQKGVSNSLGCEEKSWGASKPFGWSSAASASHKHWTNPHESLSACFKTGRSTDKQRISNAAYGSGIALSDVLHIRRSSTVELSPNFEEDAIAPPIHRDACEVARCSGVAKGTTALQKAHQGSGAMFNAQLAIQNPSQMRQTLLSRQRDAQQTAAGMWSGSVGCAGPSHRFDEPSIPIARRAERGPICSKGGIFSESGSKPVSTLREAERRIPGMFKRACQQELPSTAKKQCIRPTLGTSLAVCNPQIGLNRGCSNVAHKMASPFDDSNYCPHEMQESEESEDDQRDQVYSPSSSLRMMPCSMAPDLPPVVSPVLVRKQSGGLKGLHSCTLQPNVTPAYESDELLSPTFSVHTPPERIGVSSMQPPGAPMKKSRAAFLEAELQYMSSGEIHDVSERSVFDHGAFAPGAPEWSPRPGVRRALRFDDLSMED